MSCECESCECEATIRALRVELDSLKPLVGTAAILVKLIKKARQSLEQRSEPEFQAAMDLILGAIGRMLEQAYGMYKRAE